MNVLQTMKHLMSRLQSNSNSLFRVPVSRQKAYLDARPEPEDAMARSYNQYRCQMMLDGRVMCLLYNIAAFVLDPIYRHKLLAQATPDTGGQADAVFAYDGADTILPPSLRGEFPVIKHLRDFQQDMMLLPEDLLFLRQMRRRYPFAVYFRFKCMLKIGMYRAMIEAYHPKAIIVSEEYSFTSSLLTAYCEQADIQHINVMHGEKLFYIRDSFFTFHRCYVWDDCYRRLFTRLRAEPSQFRVELPPAQQPWNLSDVEKTVDYTYYLQAEPKDTLQKIAEALHQLRAAGAVVAVRPHPLYTDKSLVEDLFRGFLMEDHREIGIEQSVLRTRHAVSLYSTVLFQAHTNGVAIVLDDISAPERYRQLESLDYIMLQKPHTLLSEHLKESPV